MVFLVPTAGFFLFLIREFSEGKVKQKVFFHSAYNFSLLPLDEDKKHVVVFNDAGILRYPKVSTSSCDSVP
jgi:hypothetical protein